MRASEHAVERHPAHGQPVLAVHHVKRHLMPIVIAHHIAHGAVGHGHLLSVGVHHLDVHAVLTIGQVRMVKGCCRIVDGCSQGLNRRARSLFSHGLRIQFVRLVNGVLVLRNLAPVLRRGLVHFVHERRKRRRRHHACSQRCRQNYICGTTRQGRHQGILAQKARSRGSLIVRLRIIFHPTSFPRHFRIRAVTSRETWDGFSTDGELPYCFEQTVGSLSAKLGHKLHMGNSKCTKPL